MYCPITLVIKIGFIFSELMSSSKVNSSSQRFGIDVSLSNSVEGVKLERIKKGIW